MIDFPSRLARHAAAIESVLTTLLADTPAEGETRRPARLVAAMRHAALGGGKRLRPFLVIEAAALFGAEAAGVRRAAAAVELLHCYSLVHDDLPAMDDDDLRRGRPTVHKAYDEATAILAGDALLTLAFDTLADPATDRDPAIRAALVLGLARATGVGGMVGGQMLDLEAEAQAPDEAGIRDLQAMKTGALLCFSVEAGAILGRASEAERAALIRYGRALGAAFQLADDLLDETSTEAVTGKRTGKDAARGKGTLVALHGIERSREMLAGLVAEAEAALAPFGARAEFLREAALFVAERES